MSLKDRILESPLGYELWSGPLNRPKVAAIRRLMERAGKSHGSFLDVGCGPGSNSQYFGSDGGYLGIDINPAYIQQAQRKFPALKFAVGDAASLDLGERKFDVVLLNSLVHHLDDEQARALMSGLHHLVSPGSIVVVQEPLIPLPQEWFMRMLMQSDRGKHFRHLGQWQKLFMDSGYALAQEEFYRIPLFGLDGWKMYSVMLRVAR